MENVSKVVRARLSSIANILGLLVTLAVLLIAFKLKVPTFLDVSNLQNLARQCAIVSMAAIGMTYVIISGAIDLSTGSVVALVTVVIAWVLKRYIPEGTTPPALIPWLSLLAGIAAGALCGLANGLMTVKLKVGAFIVTLGTMLLARGVATGVAHEEKIDSPLTWLTDLLAVLDKNHSWMLVPWGVWLTILLAIVMSVVLRKTTFGRNVIAVGGSERACLYSGVPVDRVRVWVFVIAGVFAGFGGLLQYARLSVGDPTVAVGLELQVIAAVVIGGASLNGGQGSIVGSLLGAMIMTVIDAGCSQIGWSNWVQSIFTGTAIVVAVALDRWRYRKTA